MLRCMAAGAWVRFYFAARAARFRFRGVRPSQGASVQVEGAAPLRILLAGAGRAAGSSGRTHDEGLAGALASAVGKESGRGVRVDLRVAPALAARNAVELLGLNGSHTYDLAVFAPCFLEANFAPGAGMPRHGAEIQRHLLETGSDRLTVVMVGIPRPTRYSLLNLRATEAATETNRAMRANARDDPRVIVVEPPEFESIDSPDPFDQRYHAELGRRIADALPALDRRV